MAAAGHRITASALSSSNSSTYFLALAAKHILWLFMWLLVAFYAMAWIIMPAKDGKIFYGKVRAKFQVNKQWGRPGVYLLMFTGPVIILAVVACLYLELEKYLRSSRKNTGVKRSGWARRVYDSLWTQPLVVRGPMGMMTAAEIVGFAMVVFVSLWHFWKYTTDYFKVIDAGLSKPSDPNMSRAMQKFEEVAVMLGWASLAPLAVLFLPVTRGSSILKLIDIPFEHAVKYHVWLGHMTMLLVTAHGIAYGIFYGVNNEAHLIVKWQRIKIANLPGLIALVAGIMMWVTSFAVVRRRFFNFFYNIHQLYVVFFAFVAWHLGIQFTAYFLGGVFLFFIDRFLRFLQSRKAIRGVTARVLPSGVVELKLPVSSGFSYTPLSFMFLNVRGLSRLQWHPYSTSSTSLDNSKFLSILIKPLGDWTEDLSKFIMLHSEEDPATKPNNTAHCPFSMKLFAEGPYGHESNYFLRYKHLLLVAGGIGVTPFMAIIQDILFRYQLEQDGLPTTVDLIWCVKRRSELSLLKEVLYPARIFSKYGKSSSDFRLNVKIFLTAEQVAIPSTRVSPLNVVDESAIELQDKTSNYSPGPPANMNGGRVLQLKEDQARSSRPTRPVLVGGSGSDLMMLAGVISVATLGLVLFMAMFRVYVYHPHTDPAKKTQLPGSIEVLLFLISLLLAIVGFGGAVVCGSWLATKHLNKPAGGKDETKEHTLEEIVDVEDNSSLLDHSSIVVGTRPNFFEVFNEIRGQYGDSVEDVGVLVCGPESLAASVAGQCRSQNFKHWKDTSTTHFHYHSVSFDL